MPQEEEDDEDDAHGGVGGEEEDDDEDHDHHASRLVGLRERDGLAPETAPRDRGSSLGAAARSFGMRGTRLQRPSIRPSIRMRNGSGAAAISNLDARRTTQD
jgi:hypothetical protein